MKWAIDVSLYDARHWSGTGWSYDLPMDWVKAREVGGLSMAIIKSSEGINYKDPAFDIQWKAARGVLPRAAYHFFRSNQDATQQAVAYWTYLQAAGFGAGDYAILDYETLDGADPITSMNSVQLWLYEIEKHGITPMIYTFPGFWQSVKGETAAGTWAARFPLVLAQWPKDIWVLNFPVNIFDAQKLAALKNAVASGVLQPTPLKPWTFPAIWQFTARADTKAVPGHPAIKKVCDYDAILMELGSGGTPGPIPGPAHPQYRTLYTLNVRAGPSQTAPVLGTITAGAILSVDIEQPQSGYIHFTNNLYGPAAGWVWAAYTQKV